MRVPPGRVKTSGGTSVGTSSATGAGGAVRSPQDPPEAAFPIGKGLALLPAQRDSSHRVDAPAEAPCGELANAAQSHQEGGDS